MMLKKLLLILIALYSAEVFSCSCAPQPENHKQGVEEALKHSSSVVLAVATSVIRVAPEDGQFDQEEDITEFSEIESWKGGHGKIFHTKIATVCCICGFKFQQGATYLLYLNGPNTQGFYTTNICSRTKILERAKTDLPILRQLGAKQPIKRD